MDDYASTYYQMTPCRKIIHKSVSGSALPPQQFEAYILHGNGTILVVHTSVGYYYGSDFAQGASAFACKDEADVWIRAVALRDIWYAALPAEQRRYEEERERDGLPF